MWNLLKIICLDKTIHRFIIFMILFYGFLYIAVDLHWRSCQRNPNTKIVCVNDDCQCVDKNVQVKEYK
jgi:hypothetical protein